MMILFTSFTSSLSLAADAIVARPASPPSLVVVQRAESRSPMSPLSSIGRRAPKNWSSVAVNSLLVVTL